MQAIIRIDGQVVHMYPLDKPSLIVGRRSGSDIQISSNLISGQHAVLKKQNDQWTIIDQGSRNGLMYRGKRVEQQVLLPGDAINLAPNVVLQIDPIV
jgi:pSer/pThr/pTyr-binding forkhead associated (FHA) protein